MPRTIDWYYHRKGCTSCARADAFLQRRGLAAREVVDARKVKMGKPQIAALLRASHEVISSRGRRVSRFDLRQDPPVEKVRCESLLGPTGHLRAPALRCGRTLVVGFSEESWEPLFG